MKNLFAYYQPYKTTLAITLGTAVIISLMELCFPMYLRYILNTILPTGDMGELLKNAGLLFALYMVAVLGNYLVMLKGRTIGAYIERDMRRAIFQHVESLSFSFFDNQRVGQLVSRIVSDVGEIREIIFLGPNYLIVCVIFMIGTIAMLFSINWKLALVVNVLLILKAVDSVNTNKKLKIAGRAARTETGNISAFTTESLSAIRVVQAFDNVNLETSKLDEHADNLLKARQKNFSLLGHSNSAMVFFTNITNLVIIVIGGYLIAIDEMSMADLITFILYVSVFVRPVLRLNALADLCQKGMASYARFAEFMGLEPEILDKADSIDAGHLKGNISFKNVTFAYAGQEAVLKNFSLDIKAGERIAFVGGTGVGKSTLLNLVPRFYEPLSGCITIDGRDIKDFTLRSLRNNIGVVAQDVFLFSDSIRNNIEYGKPGASFREIQEAASYAEADRFIDKLAERYATKVGERGVKLSGGQKQRIAISRVFLKNPPILILDEATSALDNETEKAIQQSLAKLSQNRTTLVVAHRLATIRNVDRIVVISQEGILEQGTHDELIAKCGEYYKLYMTQFEKE
ncbi:MAG: ABC transporter ATP-binding protein [Phascolarctobacterium sp.]|nr:ABC transporter ATP-binding protein [Phascolarctobacterium sp.]